LKKYRKKPVVVEAVQWFKNGDHPEDDCRWVVLTEDQVKHLIDSEICLDADTDPFLSEGKIVRYYRHPRMDGETACSKCGDIMHNHGWIDTLEDGHNVCPGDWIIKGVKGEFYPCKPDIFELTYEEVNV
jgi:hypothetical protein